MGPASKRRRLKEGSQPMGEQAATGPPRNHPVTRPRPRDIDFSKHTRKNLGSSFARKPTALDTATPIDTDAEKSLFIELYFGDRNKNIPTNWGAMCHAFNTIANNQAASGEEVRPNEVVRHKVQEQLKDYERHVMDQSLHRSRRVMLAATAVAAAQSGPSASYEQELMDVAREEAAMKDYDRVLAVERFKEKSSARRGSKKPLVQAGPEKKQKSRGGQGTAHQCTQCGQQTKGSRALGIMHYPELEFRIGKKCDANCSVCRLPMADHTKLCYKRSRQAK